ncbi:MAG: creatininase family protein [Rhizobiaceae bacterium]|nr:creatininase family protein [Rhizobiaceae bacterium]
MQWEKLTTREIEAVERSTPVVLNIAAIEQHGPHLPLDTDAAIGTHLLTALDRAAPDAQLILPQIKVGCSAHHADFAGTLCVPHSVLLDYVCGILESVRASGFRNLLLLNSHGGNEAIGRVIVEHFGARHSDCRIALVTWWTLAQAQLTAFTESGPFGTGHACEFETSLMMAADAIPEDTAIPAGTFHAPSFDWADGSMLKGRAGTLYRPMREISGGTGISGQPELGTRAKGERITEAVTIQLARVVADMRRAVEA